MALVALSRVVHGNDDGSRKVFEPGDEVKGLDKDVLETLKEAGAVGEPATASPDELQALRDKVAALEAELGAARDPEATAAAKAAADKAAADKAGGK